MKGAERRGKETEENIRNEEKKTGGKEERGGEERRGDKWFASCNVGGEIRGEKR